jgi:hypothetical protein
METRIEGGTRIGIDEADTFLQGKEELRGILNAGYSQDSAYVVRVDPTIWTGLRKFSCW